MFFSESSKEAFEPHTVQLTSQTVDDFGVPVQFGIRVTPKVSSPSRGSGCCYGLELVVFAELWFRNLTSLPIDFGCPWSQLSSQKTADSGPNLQSLPLETGKELVHEVFEYMEVESSIVKRRWWAAEQYDNQRTEIAKFPESGSYWKWIDGGWVRSASCILKYSQELHLLCFFQILDSSGQVKKSDGSWESCRSLGTGRDSYFSGLRILDAGHVFRRRRVVSTILLRGRFIWTSKWPIRFSPSDEGIRQHLRISEQQTRRKALPE
jgi:hypothetical protein